MEARNQNRSRISEKVLAMGQEAAFGILARARELESQGRNVIHLEIGEPDFDTPDHIKKAATEAINNGDTHYTPTPGIPELRQAIVEGINLRLNLDLNWRDNVLVTVGGKEAVFASLLTVINEGDEIIYPNPGYPAYESAINYSGGKSVPLRLSEENEFRMTPEEVHEQVNDKTKAIVINTPENPCGSVLTETDVKGLTEIAEDHNAYILSDELYSSILFDDTKHYSPLEFAKSLDNVIIIDGFSKKYAMTGWRLGYAVVPKEVVTPMSKLLNNLTSCPSSFVQRCGVAALKGPEDSVRRMVGAFSERRDVVYQEVGKVRGVSAVMPRGAFYLFVNIKEVLSRANMNSEQFVLHILDRDGVATLHGTAMGSYGEGYLRISFANSIENLQEGVRRIGEATEQILSG